MARTDIFHTPRREIVKEDPRIVRVPFEQQEVGARASHLPKNIKNKNTIKHIKE